MQKIRKVFAKVVAGLLIVSNLAIAAPSMTYAASATSFTTYGGWNEMMYATIKGVKDADVTAVSYSGFGATGYSAPRRPRAVRSPHPPRSPPAAGAAAGTSFGAGPYTPPPRQAASARPLRGKCAGFWVGPLPAPAPSIPAVWRPRCGRPPHRSPAGFP